MSEDQRPASQPMWVKTEECKDQQAYWGKWRLKSVQTNKWKFMSENCKDQQIYLCK